MSLIDDLTADAIERMRADGFEPAVVIETSPNNFQAWLNHGQILEAATSTRAAKQLAERFAGDRSSADWRHFGRLARFTNPKRERQLPSGMRPFVRLRSAKGRVYSRAAEFLARVSKDDLLASRGLAPKRVSSSTANSSSTPTSVALKSAPLSVDVFADRPAAV